MNFQDGSFVTALRLDRELAAKVKKLFDQWRNGSDWMKLSRFLRELLADAVDRRIRENLKLEEKEKAATASTAKAKRGKVVRPVRKRHPARHRR